MKPNHITPRSRFDRRVCLKQLMLGAMVISGHVCVTGRRSDVGKHGNTVHQIVDDYQNQEKGGNGFLRLLQFPPEGKTIRVVDYSPYLDQNSPIKNTDFVIDLPAAPTRS